MRGGVERGQTFSEINVTPFVDVMLVLLIVFMVAAPMLRRGIDVEVTLPKASTAQDVAGNGVTISLTKEHVIYFNQEVVTLKELRRKLVRVRRDEPVLIQADRYAYVSKLIELWDLCRDVGVRQIHIATLPQE